MAFILIEVVVETSNRGSLAAGEGMESVGYCFLSFQQNLPGSVCNENKMLSPARNLSMIGKECMHWTG